MLWNTPGTRARAPAECTASTEARMARPVPRPSAKVRASVPKRTPAPRERGCGWTRHRGRPWSVTEASTRRRPLPLRRLGAAALRTRTHSNMARSWRGLRPGGLEEEGWFGVCGVGRTSPRGGVLEYPRGSVLEFGVCGWARRAFLDGRAKGDEPNECRLRDELHDLCERVLQTCATQRSRSPTRLSA